MKALIKLNLTLHLEEPETQPLDKFGTGLERDGLVAKEAERRRYLSYPVSIHIAGEREVQDQDDAKSIVRMLEENFKKAFGLMSVSLVEPKIILEKMPAEPPDPESNGASGSMPPANA